MQHLQPNTTLQGGKYRIERVLGQGGFGITYLAVLIQKTSNKEVHIPLARGWEYKHVAIKELFIGGTGQAINRRKNNLVFVTNAANEDVFKRQKEKFKKEAQRLAGLSHPNLVKVYDWFEENGTAYYVMDYVEGISLRNKLQAKGILSEKIAMNYFHQVLSALEVAHKQNIWHLDIKPENIMVDKDNHIYLIDFGASKHIEQNAGTLTTSSMVTYTPGYYPPEQSTSTMRNIGAWTDFYALGATLYNLITNHEPPTFDIIISEGHHAFMFPNNLSPQTRYLILWMMKVNRHERPQNISDIYSYLNKNEDTIIEIENNKGIRQDYQDPGEQEYSLTRLAPYLLFLIPLFFLSMSIWVYKNNNTSGDGYKNDYAILDSATAVDSALKILGVENIDVLAEDSVLKSEFDSIVAALTYPKSVEERPEDIEEEAPEEPLEEINQSEKSANDDENGIENENGARKVSSIFQVINNESTQSCGILSVLTSYTGEIIIPESINGYRVAYICGGAFRNCQNITSVIILSSITKIWEGTFSGCTKLSSISIPKSVTSIGAWVFKDCTNLTSITIPNSVTTIGTGAFSGCTSLISVILPNKINAIEPLTFADCISLTSVTIPEGVLHLTSEIFSGCVNLRTITLPSSLKGIGTSNFKDCPRLERIVSNMKSPCNLYENEYNNCNLIIPYGTKEMYEEKGYDKHFSRIVEQ